ncbi:MAG: DUF2304 domain-containing protein [Candidatus Woesearchaeota archaeon]
MIAGIQILGMLFGLFMLYITFLYRKRSQITFRESLFWSVLWLFFFALSLFPTSLNFIVRDVLRMQRPLDFFIILGFMFLIGISFYNYSIVRKNEKRIGEIVRKIAFKKVGEKK